MPCTSSWTDERVDQLTILWREGLSASAIARALGGVTRNAVIGKIHRLGLDGRVVPARPGRRKSRSVGTRRRAVRLRPAAVLRPWPEVVEPLPAAGLADMVSVGPHACRWPLGDPKAPGFTLCGRLAVRGAYCGPHGALAYRPTPRDHLLKLAGLR